jgi:hypothetical protein
MKYAVEMSSGATIYTPSFIKIGLGIQKLMGGGILLVGKKEVNYYFGSRDGSVGIATS